MCLTIEMNQTKWNVFEILECQETLVMKKKSTFLSDLDIQ